MSQAKVDKYKQEKANRKQTLAKQQAKRKMQKLVGGLVAVVFVGWVGISSVDAMQSLIPRTEIEIDYAAIDDYIQGLSQ